MRVAAQNVGVPKIKYFYRMESEGDRTIYSYTADNILCTRHSQWTMHCALAVQSPPHPPSSIMQHAHGHASHAEARLLSLSFRGEVTAATSTQQACCHSVSTAVQSAEAERSRVVIYVVSQCRLSACVRPLRMFDFQYGYAVCVL